MARFKRGIIGMLVGHLYIRPDDRYYVVAGKDSVGREVILVRHKVFAEAVAAGSAAAQMLADMKGVVVHLENPPERLGEFYPGSSFPCVT